MRALEGDAVNRAQFLYT